VRLSRRAFLLASASAVAFVPWARLNAKQAVGDVARASPKGNPNRREPNVRERAGGESPAASGSRGKPLPDRIVRSDKAKLIERATKVEKSPSSTQDIGKSGLTKPSSKGVRDTKKGSTSATSEAFSGASLATGIEQIAVDFGTAIAKLGAKLAPEIKIVEKMSGYLGLTQLAMDAVKIATSDINGISKTERSFLAIAKFGASNIPVAGTLAGAALTTNDILLMNDKSGDPKDTLERGYVGIRDPFVNWGAGVIEDFQRDLENQSRWQKEVFDTY
jgi:hypothetical protein